MQNAYSIRADIWSCSQVAVLHADLAKAEKLQSQLQGSRGTLLSENGKLASEIKELQSGKAEADNKIAELEAQV